MVRVSNYILYEPLKRIDVHSGINIAWLFAEFYCQCLLIIFCTRFILPNQGQFIKFLINSDAS